MKKLAAAVLCSLAITATAGLGMVAEAAHGDKVNIAEPFKVRSLSMVLVLPGKSFGDRTIRCG